MKEICRLFQCDLKGCKGAKGHQHSDRQFGVLKVDFSDPDARLFGFRTAEIADLLIDENARRGISDGYSLTSHSKREESMDKVLVCYQPYDQFMARFAGNGNS